MQKRLNATSIKIENDIDHILYIYNDNNIERKIVRSSNTFALMAFYTFIQQRKWKVNGDLEGFAVKDSQIC